MYFFQSSFKLANSLDLHEFILNAFSVIGNVNDITSKYDIFELKEWYEDMSEHMQN